MAAEVRGLRVCVEAEAGEAAGDAASASGSGSGSASGSGSGSASDSGSGSGSESEREREEEPMEVEEGEIETEKLDSIAVQRSLKDLIPDTSRHYENKAGTFITGIDVTSKEAVERKEQRARRFHLSAEVNVTQRKVVLDKEILREAIPKIRLEALHVTGVDEMSTEEIFAYFKEYPPSSIEWIDDSSCNVVWLDDVTAARAMINLSVGADMGKEAAGDAKHSSKTQDGSNEHDPAERAEDEEEEGELEKDPANTEEVECKPPADPELETLSQAEQASILQNQLRPAIQAPQGNKLQVRFATREDHKEMGAARRSQYYMKYGNPNYGGMKGILSNSWKRRYHARRVQRDVLKRKSFLPDDVELESHYKHHHSGLGNVPEEPIQEEDEDETEQDMEADDRVVVEYCNESRSWHSSPHASDSDEMDYDLELKMISMPSPKKSLKMTMYADEVEARLKTIRNSIRPEVSSVPAVPNVKNRIGARLSTEKVSDVRLLLEEKRQLAERQQPGAASSSTTGVRQRLGKRPHSPQSSSVTVSRREPQTDVHSRLGIAKHDGRSFPQDKPKKTGGLWSRLGKGRGKGEKSPEKEADKEAPVEKGGEEEEEETVEAEEKEEKEEDGDVALQRAWGALIREKERSHKKSRLDNLPSLQIEISRESSTSDSES
ncbi:nuclear cap-binding protein subunit 3 [Rhinoraja longicauda]